MGRTEITLSEILNLLSSLRHRAEKSDELNAYLPSFVPVVDIGLLGNKNTQVIYGRNGTGKTHVMKCYEEMALLNIMKNQILPIYFDMRLLNISRLSPDLSEEDVVFLFFDRFLYQCVEKVEDLIDGILRNPFCSDEQRAWLNSRATQSAVSAALKQLRRAFNQRMMRERIESYTKSLRNSRDQSSTLSAEAGGDESGIFAKIGFGAGRAEKAEEFSELVIKASHFIDFDQIRSGFDALTKALDLRHIVFLIDEYSQIDIDVQPVFAELIRRTIGTSNNVCCKIAALKFQTSFTSIVNERRIGLQPGIDITELVDLNHIFTFDLDRNAVRGFLVYILLKHLLEEIASQVYNINLAEERKVVAGNVKQIFEKLFTAIFESPDAFDYFIKCSEGNPRDFLAMISECCATHGTAQLPISLQAVQASAISYFKSTKIANFQGQSDRSLRLFNKIFERCLLNKSKIFSVSTELDRACPELVDLWSQRIIHLIDNHYEYYNTDDNTVYSFSVYAIDYGKILGLRSSAGGTVILDELVHGSDEIVSSLYDGSIHRKIKENIEKEDSRLATVSQIIGAEPASSGVFDQTDILAPNVVFEKIQRINVDNIVMEVSSIGFPTSHS